MADDPSSQAAMRFRRVRKGLWIFAAAVFAVTVILSAIYAPRLRELRSEYRTKKVIRATLEFVKTHPGQWPQSWEDVGEVPDCRRFTIFRFDLTPGEILADREVIQNAIMPRGGTARYYPEIRRDLDAVYQAMKGNLAPSSRDRGRNEE